MKNTMNKKLIILLGTITSLFLIIAVYLIYFELFKSAWLNNHNLNRRNYVDETKYKRGSILDRNGKILAESVLEENKYKRVNTYNYMYSSIIGYNSIKYGRSGIEASLNSELLNTSKSKNIFDKIEDSVINKDEGNDVYLTIDDRIQSYAYDALGNRKGVVIVTNPKNGEILAMVSKPGFNVNKLEENWEEYINSKQGIMLNRATQGLYEPGSIFKIITSMAFLDKGIDLEYNDTGQATIGGYTVKNYMNGKHGKMDLRKALMVSSNTYFFEKSQEITNTEFIKTLDKFGMTKDYNFELPKKKPIFPFKEGLSALGKANAAFGQGKTYVNPLTMSLSINAIANEGIVYKPQIIKSIKRSNSERNIDNQILTDDINKNNANLIKEYLHSTDLDYGIGKRFGISLAGKTGTAENSTKYDHRWYMGMTPVENPKYTVVVLVEGTDESTVRASAHTGAKILKYCLSLD